MLFLKHFCLCLSCLVILKIASSFINLLFGKKDQIISPEPSINDLSSSSEQGFNIFKKLKLSKSSPETPKASSSNTKGEIFYSEEEESISLTDTPIIQNIHPNYNSNGGTPILSRKKNRKLSRSLNKLT